MAEGSKVPGAGSEEPQAWSIASSRRGGARRNGSGAGATSDETQKSNSVGALVGLSQQFGDWRHFWLVCWMEEKVAVGVLIFFLAAAVGLYLLCASDEALSKSHWK